MPVAAPWLRKSTIFPSSLRLRCDSLREVHKRNRHQGKRHQRQRRPIDSTFDQRRKELAGRRFAHGGRRPFAPSQGSWHSPARPIGEVARKRPASPCADPEGNWYGLTVRARVLVYAKGRVKPSELSTYEDLASSKWRARLTVRSSKQHLQPISPRLHHRSQWSREGPRLGQGRSQEHGPGPPRKRP